MTTPYRVLIADDSVALRKTLERLLEEDEEMELAASCKDGSAALESFTLTKPDIVVLDVEMPVMDGLTALARIRELDTRTPIVMFSSVTQRGARTTIEALSRGATDCVPKPAGAGAYHTNVGAIRTELLDKLKEICSATTASARSASARCDLAPTIRKPSNVAKLSDASHASSTTDPKPARTQTGLAPSRHCEASTPTTRSVSHRAPGIVAIASSTGGPRALDEVLSAIPGNLPVPIVIVQHMPSEFTSLLASRLDTKCEVEVREGKAGDRLRPGVVYIAPGGRHMIVERSGLDATLDLTDTPPVNSCRPAADVLFESVAAAFKRRSLAVVLTGIGKDGLDGGRKIVEVGGRLIAQDKATSVVWGMPGAVTEAGIASTVLPLGEIAASVTDAIVSPAPLLSTKSTPPADTKPRTA